MADNFPLYPNPAGAGLSPTIASEDMTNAGYGPPGGLSPGGGFGVGGGQVQRVKIVQGIIDRDDGDTSSFLPLPVTNTPELELLQQILVQLQVNNYLLFQMASGSADPDDPAMLAEAFNNNPLVPSELN